MATESGKKLFVGPRFRRIRQKLGLSQTQIAEGLGISPSYINLIERNQRPVTAQILLRLAETYDLDLRDIATADEDRFFRELNVIFFVPLFRTLPLTSPPVPAFRTGRPAWPRLPARLPARAWRIRAAAGDHHRPRRPARRRAPPPIPHHACQLFCRRRDDALSGVPRSCRSAQLRH